MKAASAASLLSLFQPGRSLNCTGDNVSRGVGFVGGGGAGAQPATISTKQRERRCRSFAFTDEDRAGRDQELCVATRIQLGLRDRSARLKVQKSVFSMALSASPSTT